MLKFKKNKNHVPTAEGIVVGGGQAPKPKKPPKPKLIKGSDIAASSTPQNRNKGLSKIKLGSGISLIALICLGGWLFMNRGPEKLSDGTEVRQLESNELINETNRLIGQGKYEDARKLANSQNNGEQSLEVQLALAASYIVKKDHQGALSVLLEAEKQFNDQFVVTRLIGQQYEALGDKSHAVVYYGKTIELLKNAEEYELAPEDIVQMEKAIQRLEQS